MTFSLQVMKILNLSPGDVVCFKSSFNRANLRQDRQRLEVLPRTHT